MKFVASLLIAMLTLGVALPSFTFAQAEPSVDEDELLADLLADLAGDEEAPEAQQAPSPEPMEEPEAEPMVEEPMAEPEAGEAEGEEHNAAEDVLDLIENEIDSAWMNADGANDTIEAKMIESDRVQIEFSQVTYEGAPVAQYKVYYGETAIGGDSGFDGLDSVTVSPLA